MSRSLILFVFIALPAAADPKPEALDAIKWGFSYCKDALNPEKGISEAEGNYEKWKKKLAAAEAADPTIREWTGVQRDWKVNEGIVKCEKEIPARIESSQQAMDTGNAVDSLRTACRTSMTEFGNFEKYKQDKEALLKKNPNALTPDAAAKLDACEKEYAAWAAENAKRHADIVAMQKKREAEDRAAVERAEQEEKKLVASLKGDRARIYKAYGKPTNWKGDKTVEKANIWEWYLDKELGALKGTCWTTVTFKGDTKASEKESGAACKW